MTEFVNNRTLLTGEGALTAAIGKMTTAGYKKACALVFHRNDAYVQNLLDRLHAAGMETAVFDGFSGEPCLSLVDGCTAFCKENNCDCVIACGGGTVIDTAKLVAMMATNGGCCEAYQMDGRQVTKEPLFFLAIPTTAGTGAEATKVSVIFNENRGFKKAVYDNSMIAQMVVLDPNAVASLPQKITASTGIDAIIHAVESCVSTNASLISRAYSLAAIPLLMQNLRTCCSEPSNLAAREKVQLGSYFAGLALTAGSGLAHIVGQPIGALYHIPHGEACSAFFLNTLQMNRDYAEAGYTDLAKAMGVQVTGRSYTDVFDEMYRLLQSLMLDIGVPVKLTDCVPQEKFDVEAAVDNVCACMSHIKCNPRPVSREIYREAITGAM